ncbi:MAG: hypothetical protein E6H08_00180 [Bacteroidetes bacterium]|nr:MAG: hypothetical protein E6H08_00180 [Bacteroidota bacterium]
MKRISKASLMAIVVLLFGALQNKSSAQVSVNVSFQSFYDELSPYGNWISYPEYGYVWHPDNRYRDFQPYRSDGHWAWSDDGWLWVSDYEWGWAPFHYGRWVNDPYEGWLWVPDYEWAPAWVVWRGGDDYYGWAPMSPGVSINLYLGNRYNVPSNYWCFAPSRYITSPHLSNYYFDRGRNTTIINHTTIINNYDRNRGYVIGPSHNEVERYTGSRIDPVRIRESQRAGRTIERSNEISIYKPYINRGSDRGTPRTFENSRQQSQNVITDRNVVRQERPYQDRGTQTERQFPNQNDQRVERQQVPDQNRRVERPYQNRGNQQMERQQFPNQNDQRIERQQIPDQNNQRVERQQVPDQNSRRMERPYQNRGNQQMERQQFPSQNDQRVERQQIPDQNQRVERQQMPNQNNQRMERPYQNRGQQQQVERPVQTQPQQQQEQRGNGNGNGHGRGRGRGN